MGEAAIRKAVQSKDNPAEPGSMRTDWAGSSMDFPAHASQYADSVAAIATALHNWPIPGLVPGRESALTFASPAGQ